MLALKRRAAWLAALGLAAALHAAAGLGLAVKPAAAPPPPRPAMALRWVAAPAPLAAPAAAESATNTEPAGASALFTSPPTGSLVEASRGPEFLASDEVDEPARPLHAWTLDAEALSSLGITRIVFDVWVDEHSALVALRVVHLEPAASADLAPLVEARLADTLMTAALVGGRPVTHRQRIELAWEQASSPAAASPG